MLLLVALSAVGMVLHLVPIQGKVIAADRFLYLPVALLGALVAVWLTKASSGRALVAAVILLLSYAPATWQRAGVWGDDIAFWGTAVSERGASLNAHARLGLGNLLAEHGMYDEALDQYAQAERGDARSWMLCQYNRSGLLAMNGEFDAAISVLEQARQRAPALAQLERLALFHASKGEEDQALALAQEYAREALDPPQAEQLEEKVRTIVRLMPEVQRPRHTLPEKLAQARGYAEVGLFRLAMSELVSLAADPGITPAHLQGMISSALEHGMPEQILAVQARLDALGVGYPPAYVQLLEERHARVGRLREWIRKTDRP
jgi:tetratricopeptide (TPR) repeat protein